MKSIAIGIKLNTVLALSSFAFLSAANAEAEAIFSNVITLECTADSPFQGKFEGKLEASKLANQNETELVSESGSADLTLSRTETEILPDGSAARKLITSQIASTSFEVHSIFLPAGQLLVHDATVITFSLPSEKTSVRIILEMPGSNATVTFDGARYLGSCHIKK